MPSRDNENLSNQHSDGVSESKVPSQDDEWSDPVSKLFRFIGKIWSGECGLAMTYWVYGILGGIVWGVAFATLYSSTSHNYYQQEESDKTLFFIAMAFYYFIIYVGIWNAANKYTGSKIWAVLAKFVVIIVVLPIAIKVLQSFSS